jgi:carboxyl-terminal processing protease
MLHAMRLAGCSALVAWALALALGCSDDASNGGPDSTSGQKTGAEEPQVDMAEKLGLDQRHFPLLIWSAYIVSEDYFDPGRFEPKAQIKSSVEQLGLHTPEFFATVDGDDLGITVRSQKHEFSMAGVDDLLKAADLLEQILMFTQVALDLEGEPLHELEYAAINGFLAPLDPHTILLTPEQHADLGVKTRGQFGGIGAEIRAEDRRIIVVRVIPGSPAEKFGVQSGDVVVQIDDQSTVNMSSQAAQELIRGPVGTKLKLKVRRGDQLLTLEVERDTIKIESVRSTMLPDRIGYVSISTFQKDTAEKLEGVIKQMAGEGELRGLVIDLRGNSGGLLTQASGILDQMATEGDVVVVFSAEGREAEEATEKLVLPGETAVVVLVNEDSASASEIVGGSVKHLGRGVVVGRGSFGKGTVQMLKAATPYERELALKLTVAEYRVAGDRKIQGVGVRPDLELFPVQLSELDSIAAYYDEERFERQRERAKTAHLPSAKHDDGSEAFVGKAPPLLHYLDAPQTLAGAAGEKVQEMTDPEIRIARDVAHALAGKSNRKDMVATLGSLVESIAADEDDRITKAFAQRDLDWAGKVGEAASPTLEVSSEIRGPSPIPAGEPFTLAVTVKNTGSEVVSRVHAITQCSQDELDGIEVLFGSIAPGEERSRQLSLHVMPWHTDLAGKLAVEVHAGEPESAPDGRAETRFEVVGQSRPRFSYDYWIVDDPELAKAAPARPPAAPIPGEAPFSVLGNGDGMLQAGERVLLAFEVRNDGTGKAIDARAFLRNLSGAQGLLEEGLAVVGSLGAGKTATGAFGITISPNADPAIPIELDLAIGDTHLRESARHKLRLRVTTQRPAFAAKKSRALVSAESARIYNGADSSAAVVSELETGSRVDLVGEAGDWAALATKRGRRVWVPKDVLEEGAGKKAKLERAGLIVDPPRVNLEAVPRSVSSDAVTIKGTAEHPRRVRDVVVKVKPSAPSSRERKVYYLANPQVDGAAAKSMQFETRVPLDKGSNRISIIVRDGSKVERRRDVLVYRE